MKIASERGYDLVEVSPLAEPPVCKLLDYGQYLYSQKKKEKKQKQSQKKVEVKGIRISMRTGEHDLEIKSNQAKKFLEQEEDLEDKGLVALISILILGRWEALAIFSNLFLEAVEADRDVLAPKRDLISKVASISPLRRP